MEQLPINFKSWFEKYVASIPIPQLYGPPIPPRYDVDRLEADVLPRVSDLNQHSLNDLTEIGDTIYRINTLPSDI